MEIEVIDEHKLETRWIIPFNSIVLGERGRSSYMRIEELGQSIKDNGLIQPLVLVPLDDGRFGLDAGGRRYHALRLLIERGDITPFLYHASTSNPTEPGFVIKGEDQKSPLKRLQTEIAENLDREDLDWRDNMKLLKKAYTLAEADANVEGKHILMRDFGAMLGVGYAELQAACAIHDDVILHPERYQDCNGIRAAYSTLLKINADELNKMAMAKSMTARDIPQIVTSKVEVDVPVSARSEPELDKTLHIPLSEFFVQANALDYMKGRPADTFDHIITDPDYAVSIERLEASVGSASEGVAHTSIEQSLAETEQFIIQSFRLIKPQGFLVFWYDLDHHEKLQKIVKDVGFAVQRWPLIWHKTDYRSNAAPSHNFCKNMEYAMVCRKPNAVLAKVQGSSIYSCPSGEVTKELGHPFAKPYEVWQWIYNAVCIKGQTIYDPFMGRASSTIAAIRWGLRPVGSEINPDHYAGGIMNIQREYKKELGQSVSFS